MAGAVEGQLDVEVIEGGGVVFPLEEGHERAMHGAELGTQKGEEERVYHQRRPNGDGRPAA
ncbi:MAG: hypothetical protein R3F65_15900 [bacterium]